MTTGFPRSDRDTGQHSDPATDVVAPATGDPGAVGPAISSPASAVSPASSSPAGAHGRDGPPLWLPAAAFTVFTVAAAAAGAGLPRLNAAPAVTAAYAAGHTGLLRVQATLLFASAVPLAIWAAAACRRLRRLGVTAPGPLIGHAGGLLAAASLATSALATWTLAHAARDPAVADALRTLAFAAGAAGFVVPLGLLLAGVAVPMLLRRLAPRPLGWAGLVIAAYGLLATLTLLTPAFDPLLPIGRFGGLLWIMAASLTLRRPAGPGPGRRAP